METFYRVMEQKVNFFTILPNDKLGQFLLKWQIIITKDKMTVRTYKTLRYFWPYFSMLLWLIMKVAKRYAKVKVICLEWIMSPKLAGKVVNGILLPKLFWPTVRKNWSSDQKKLLKFEAEGRELAKILRSLEQFIQTVKGQNNFW